MWVDTEEGATDAVALGPIAVVPERQGCGIGSALIRAGLAVIRERGERFILVLGHPSYYPRFGFEPSVAETIDAPWSGPPWMGLILSGDPITGRARYPDAWSRLDDAP
jgi:putative acetyltransferase